MIYILPYESDTLLKNSFFKLRKLMDPSMDIIHLTVAHSQSLIESDTGIYKKALKWEGEFRTINEAWTDPVMKVRVILQL